MADLALDIERASDIILKGGLLLYPSDTIWGIGCDATNVEAIKKIYALKNRQDSKSMIVLVKDEKQISHYTNIESEQIAAVINSFDSPTTVVFPEAKNISSQLIAEDGSIAIRLCRDVFCQKIMALTGRPLVSTSANVSGHATPLHFQQIEKKIINGVDYVVNYRREEKTFGKPSRIIALGADGSVKMIRE